MPSGISNLKLLELYQQQKFEQLQSLLNYDIRELIADFQANLKGKIICKRYGIKSYVTIWKLMKTLSITSTRMGNNQNELSSDIKRILNDRELLETKYRASSGLLLAKELGIDDATVYSYLKHHGIVRSSSGEGLNRFYRRQKPGLLQLDDRNWLHEQYIVLGLTATAIANQLNITQPTVLAYLNKHGLIVRRTGVHQIKTKGDVYQILETLNDRNKLVSLYENNSSIEIANNIGCSSRLIQLYLKRHDIQTRSAIDYLHIRQPSRPQQQLTKELDDHGIIHHPCWIYEGVYNNKRRMFEIDEYLPELKCFIEVQGEHWHGLECRHWQYPRVRMKLWTDLIKWQCLKRDYPDHNIIYLSEHEISNWKQKVFRQRALKCSYNYAKLVFATNNQHATKFIVDNHYLSSTRSGVTYSISDDTQILAACVVSPPTRQTIKLTNSNYGGEISRMVAKQSIAKNILSYLLSKVIRTEKKRSQFAGLIAFADPSPVRKGEHSGSVYRSANFNYTGITASSYFYIDQNLTPIHKKTIYNRAKRMKLTEREYATKNLLHKLPEWPKHRFEILF